MLVTDLANARVLGVDATGSATVLLESKHGIVMPVAAAIHA